MPLLTFHFNPTQTQGLLLIVIAMVTALAPAIAGMLILLIQQYTKVKEAWEQAQENCKTLNDKVLPKLATMQQASADAHEQILEGVVNGNGNGQSTTATH